MYYKKDKHRSKVKEVPKKMEIAMESIMKSLSQKDRKGRKNNDIKRKIIEKHC